MEALVLLIMLAAIGAGIHAIRRSAQKYEAMMLPFGHCRKCETELIFGDEFVELGPRIYLCVNCAPGVLEEVDGIIPYWFEQPLVDGEPAQLEPIPEQTSEPVFIEGPPVPTYVSKVPLYDNLTEDEQMKWIMTGQTGRGDAYDIQMLAEYKKWMDKKAS